MIIKETESMSETFEFAREFAKQAKKGDIFCLDGDLGTGKTVFAKGFALGLGINDNITSPTFTIVQSYEGEDISLHHFDVYRIEDERELEEIGYEEYFFSDAVCLIEWSKLISGLLPENVKEIIIEKDLSKSESYRKITIKGIDE